MVLTHPGLDAQVSLSLKIRKNNFMSILPRRCKTHGATYMAENICIDARNCDRENALRFVLAYQAPAGLKAGVGNVESVMLFETP